MSTKVRHYLDICKYCGSVPVMMELWANVKNFTLSPTEGSENEYEKPVIHAGVRSCNLFI